MVALVVKCAASKAHGGNGIKSTIAGDGFADLLVGGSSRR